MSVDDAVEQVAADPAKVTVDGSQSTLDESPALRVVVVDVGVVVVQVSDGDQPVVNPHVGNKVDQPDSTPATKEFSLGSQVKSVDNQAEAEIRQGNEDTLTRAENSASRLKVADTQPARLLALLAVLTGRDVEQQVGLETSNLVENKLSGLDNRGVLEKLSSLVREEQLADGRPVLRLVLLVATLGSLGHKSHILLHVASETVVAVVGELPGEVRDEKSRVQNPANNVVQNPVAREGAVATLVGQNPDAGADKALDVAVDDPSNGAHSPVANDIAARELGDVGQGSPAKGASQGNVANNICHGVKDLALEAVCRDGIANGLDVGELVGAASCNLLFVSTRLNGPLSDHL